MCPRGGLPPGVIRKVTAERGAHRGAQLPIERSEQVVVQDITVDAHVVHELGYVSTLPGEHHLCAVINAGDRRAHFVGSTHRFPGTRVDVLTGAEGRPQRRGPRVRAVDGDSVMDVRRVPQAGVGGGALGQDTTGAATRDCTAAMRTRARGSLFTNWMDGEGPAVADCHDTTSQAGV